VLDLLAALAMAKPPAPTVLVQERVAVVRVSPKASSYRLQIKAAGATWKRARTSQKRRFRLTLDPGRYRVRAQVKRRVWSRPGAASGWFRIEAQYARHLWVNAQNGDDAGAGTPTRPLRSVTEAWSRVRARPRASTAVHVTGLAESPGYWENHNGAAVTFFGGEFSNDLNMYRVAHVTFDGVRIHRAGDVFHCERCDDITLDHVDFDGMGAAHETIKVNQSSHITIRDSTITGAYENAIDFVAVQHGLISGNDVSNGPDSSTDWCAYVKGGSAHITVRDNRIHDCGTGGFTAGQGTGFEFMVAPWLHYEAEHIDVVDNVIHDTDGAGLGVNGGHHIRLSGNVLHHVGYRSHATEFVHGARSCDGDTVICQAYNGAGGWGGIGMDGQYIPNKDVWFGNNVIANDPGRGSLWQQVQVAEPVTPPAGSNVPNPSRADQGLVIVNNIFWNDAPDDGYPLDTSNRVNTLDPRVDASTHRPGLHLTPVPVPP
jgi:hypothetical protein